MLCSVTVARLAVNQLSIGSNPVGAVRNIHMSIYSTNFDT